LASPLFTIFVVRNYEKDLSAQGSPSQAPARIQTPDAYPGGPGGDPFPAAKGPQASGRLK